MPRNVVAPVGLGPRAVRGRWVGGLAVAFIVVAEAQALMGLCGEVGWAVEGLGERGGLLLAVLVVSIWGGRGLVRRTGSAAGGEGVARALVSLPAVGEMRTRGEWIGGRLRCVVVRAWASRGGSSVRPCGPARVRRGGLLPPPLDDSASASADREPA